MGDFITKEKVKEIIDQRPEGVEPRQILDTLVARGHEIEGLNAEFSPLETVKNVPESLWEFGKGIWTAVSHPVDTGKAISSVAKGAARSLLEEFTGDTEAPLPIILPGGITVSSDASDEEAFDAMVDFFQQRYGSKDKLLNTIEKDPAGFLADASTVFTGAAGAMRGAASSGSRLARIAGTVERVGQLMDPVTALQKGVAAPIRAATRRFNEATGVNKALRNFSTRQSAENINLTSAKAKQLAREARMTESPAALLTKHGIGGSLEEMQAQVKNIWQQTRQTVDERLAQVQQRFQHRDTQVILQEAEDLLTKSFEDTYTTEDIVRISSEVTDASPILDEFGNPVTSTRTVEEVATIPGEVSQTLRVGKRNFSDEFNNLISEIRTLKTKYAEGGLTLSEMNRVKRMTDQLFDVYKQGGDPKAGVRLGNLERARKSTNKFVAERAKEAGVGNILELNQQTQNFRALDDVIGDRIIAGANKLPFLDRATAYIIYGSLGGAAGFAASGSGAAIAAGASTAIGLAQFLRIPRVRAYWANRIRLMADGEFQLLKGGVEAGRETSKLKALRQREWKRFRQAFPELRLAGVTQQQTQDRTNRQATLGGVK